MRCAVENQKRYENMNDEMNAGREPQVREWISRLEDATEKARASQQELSKRLAGVLRDEPMACNDDTKEQELVPTANVLREICRKVEHVVDENGRLLEQLEI